MTRKRYQVTVLPGDGIGAEVTEAALPIFKALDLPIELNFADIGWHFWKTEGTALPERSWQAIYAADACLLGAASSFAKKEAMAARPPSISPHRDYVSPILTLRKGLECFVSLRPCFSVKENKPFDFTIIRENSEGLYAGFDYHPCPPILHQLLGREARYQEMKLEDLSCALRVQSRQSLERLFSFAFAFAEKEKRNSVVLADKANVLRESGAFTRDIFEQEAARYPHIYAEIVHVDALAMWLIQRPESYQIIVAENMFGDILSDIGAAVMGGLGYAPSANIGLKGCYFEPVHGSGLKMASNTANPSAQFLSIGLLLNYLGFMRQAAVIKQAVIKVAQTFISKDTRAIAARIIAVCQAIEENNHDDV